MRSALAALPPLPSLPLLTGGQLCPGLPVLSVRRLRGLRPLPLLESDCQERWVGGLSLPKWLRPFPGAFGTAVEAQPHC